MSVLNFLSEETFNEQMDKANQYLKYIAAGVGVGYTPKSFAEIQKRSYDSSSGKDFSSEKKIKEDGRQSCQRRNDKS